MNYLVVYDSTQEKLAQPVQVFDSPKEAGDAWTNALRWYGDIGFNISCLFNASDEDLRLHLRAL